MQREELIDVARSYRRHGKASPWSEREDKTCQASGQGEARLCESPLARRLVLERRPGQPGSKRVSQGELTWRRPLALVCTQIPLVMFDLCCGTQRTQRTGQGLPRTLKVANRHLSGLRTNERLGWDEGTRR